MVRAGSRKARLQRVVATVFRVALVAAWVALPAVVAAASPSPSAVIGADTRSAGEGPGFVGSPGLAILAVVAIGLVAVLATLVYVRLTSGPKPGR